jgi:hypothetical protein
VRICILHVANCALIGRLRTDVEIALAIVGASAVIEELEGPYPSPTLLIDGIEVTGWPLDLAPSCRLYLPTVQQIASAILAARSEDFDLASARGG